MGAQWLACGEGSPVFLFSQLSQPLGFPSDHVADDCFISHPPTHTPKALKRFGWEFSTGLAVLPWLLTSPLPAS